MNTKHALMNAAQFPKTIILVVFLMFSNTKRDNQINELL